ncbi:MAG: OmpA family protein, partial [Elusimicrobiota bacterium]|nr:OmpA family protein [Elusimicrobiota bacterium]
MAESTKQNLQKISEEIKSMTYNVVVIEGHTDSTGNDEINKPLSIKRAKAIYDELIKNGIPAEKMRYIGFGSDIPIGDNATE